MRSSALDSATLLSRPDAYRRGHQRPPGRRRVFVVRVQRACTARAMCSNTPTYSRLARRRIAKLVEVCVAQPTAALRGLIPRWSWRLTMMSPWTASCRPRLPRRPRGASTRGSLARGPATKCCEGRPTLLWEMCGASKRSESRCSRSNGSLRRIGPLRRSRRCVVER